MGEGVNHLKIITYESPTHLPMTNVIISNVKEIRFWNSNLPTFLHNVMKYPVMFFFDGVPYRILCNCTWHNNGVWFLLILAKTANTIESHQKLINISQQTRMLLVTELFHIQLQKNFSGNLWRFLLPWCNSQIEAVETCSIEFAGKWYGGFLFEQNKGESLLQCQALNLSWIFENFGQLFRAGSPLHKSNIDCSPLLIFMVPGCFSSLSLIFVPLSLSSSGTSPFYFTDSTSICRAISRSKMWNFRKWEGKALKIINFKNITQQNKRFL